MLTTIFEQFVQMSPVSIMARGLMERIFASDRMNQLFARHAQHRRGVNSHWQVFKTYSDEQMVSLLQQLAENVTLKRFLKATRGVKKKRPPLIVNSQQRHVSTARLLETHQTVMKSRVRK